MPLRHRNLQKYGTFFITTSTFNSFHRFEINEDYEIALENIEFYRIRDNTKIHGYVIMPNHLHLLLTIPEDRNISSFIRDTKKRVAYEYLKNRKMKIQKFWQYRFDDVFIYSEEIFTVKLKYIHYNPVKAGLANRPEDWPYSSASFYSGGKSKIIKLDHLLI